MDKKKPKLMNAASRKRALIIVAKRLRFIADRTEGPHQQALDRARAAVVSVIQAR